MSSEEQPQLSPQEQEEKIVKEIEALGLEFNTSLDSLAEAESAAQDADNELFKLVISNYKKGGAIDQEEYNKVFADLLECKQDMLKKQGHSFRLLQKFHNSRCNYLAAVANAYKTKLDELTKQQEAVPQAEVPAETPVEAPVQSTSTPTPARPLTRLSSSGKVSA